MRIKALGLEDRVSMVEEYPAPCGSTLTSADVVTMYFLTSSNERLKPNLEHMKSGVACVVSEEFPVRGWKPTGSGST